MWECASDYSRVSGHIEVHFLTLERLVFVAASCLSCKQNCDLLMPSGARSHGVMLVLGLDGVVSERDGGSRSDTNFAVEDER